MRVKTSLTYILTFFFAYSLSLNAQSTSRFAPLLANKNQNDLAKKEMFLPQKIKEYAWSNAWVHTYDAFLKYNERGDLVEALRLNPKGDSVSKYVNLFDSLGNQAGYIIYQWSNMSWKGTGKRQLNIYSLDGLIEQVEQELLTNSTWRNIKRIQNTYQGGNLASQQVQTWYSNSWLDDFKSTFTYDPQARKLSEIVFKQKGLQEQMRYTYTYTGDEIVTVLIEKWDNGQWYNDIVYEDIEWLTESSPTSEDAEPRYILNNWRLTYNSAIPKAYLEKQWTGNVWRNRQRAFLLPDSFGGYIDTIQTWNGLSWDNSLRYTRYMDTAKIDTGFHFERFDTSINDFVTQAARQVTYIYDGDNIIAADTRVIYPNTNTLVNWRREEYFDFKLISGLEVAEFATGEPIRIYPNPTSNVLYISSANKINYFAIYDLNGKLVFEERLNVHNMPIQIKLPYLPQGLYIMNAIGANSTSIRQQLLIK